MAAREVEVGLLYPCVGLVLIEREMQYQSFSFRVHVLNLHIIAFTVVWVLKLQASNCPLQRCVFLYLI